MLESTITLQNHQILLRPIFKQDFPFMLTLTQEKEMWNYFTSDLSIPEELEKWAQPAFDGDRVQFTVIDKATQEILGSSAFGNYSKKDERIEIGWTWLGKPSQGKGVNSQMKFLMMEYAFEILKVKRVEIKTDVLNLPARNAMLKMGIIEEGVLRSHTLLCTGRRRDTIYYSVLEHEWPTLKENWK